MTAPAKKRKPRKVVVWVMIAGDTGEQLAYSHKRDETVLRAKEFPDDRIVRCEGVLK